MPDSCFLMLDEVVREELTKPLDISGADELIQAPHRAA
jgi:hypothetical protein